MIPTHFRRSADRFLKIAQDGWRENCQVTGIFGQPGCSPRGARRVGGSVRRMLGVLRLRRCWLTRGGLGLQN